MDPISNYSVESGDNFASWSQRLLDFMESQPKKLEETTKIGFLKLRLIGTAREAYDDLAPDDKTTLEKTIKALTKVFNSPIRRQLARQKLSLYHQGENQTIDEFIQRLVPLVNSAYQDQDPTTRKEFLKDAFKTKVKSDIAFYLSITSNPTQTFEELCGKALQIENQLQKQKQIVLPSLNPLTEISEHPYTNHRAIHPRNPNPQFEELQSSNSYREHFNMNTNKACWYCKAIGHIVAECPVRMRNYGSFPGNSNRTHPSNETSQNQFEPDEEVLKALDLNKH